MLPVLTLTPGGGYKVVYEYANRLSAKGYDVTIMYPTNKSFSKPSLLEKIKKLLRYPYYNLRKSKYSARTWFGLAKDVKERHVYSLSQFKPKEGDCCIATAVETAPYVAKYKGNINKLYLIQGFESWVCPPEHLYHTYNLGLRNIVVSNWLAAEVRKSGAEATIIRNGFDFDYFQLHRPIRSRKRASVSMLYTSFEVKGCKYGLEALEMVKKQFPELEVRMFGVHPRAEILPSWIEYTRRPNREQLNSIYNDSAIYLATSIMEGWGLTVGEAMICGGAVVCTDALGFKEMVSDGETALMCEAKNSEALARNIIRLIQDDDLRFRIAEAGNRHIQSFTWDASVDKLIKEIEQQQ